jgi:hypothetical protein
MGRSQNIRVMASKMAGAPSFRLANAFVRTWSEPLPAQPLAGFRGDARLARVIHVSGQTGTSTKRATFNQDPPGFI